MRWKSLPASSPKKENAVPVNKLHSKLGLFFTANALACVGMNVGVVGVAWFVIHSTGQNRILGLYSALSLLTAFLALAACGTLIDHRGKTAAMKYCCLGQGVLFALTALLHACGAPALLIIYLLAFLNMPCMVIFTTASRGAVPAVLPPQRLAQGNSVIEITMQLGAMAAALLTAFSYQAFGFHLLMCAGAAFTWAGAWLFARAGKDFDCPSPASEGLWKNLTEGVAYLWRDKKRLLFGLAVFLPTVVISVSNVIIPGYVQFTLKQGPLVYGTADMFFALGALLAGLYAARLISPAGIKAWQYALFAAAAAGMGLFYVNTATAGFFACVFLTGLAMAALRVLLNTSFMQCVPPQYLGRALAFLMALSVVIQALLSYAVGRMMDVFGAPSGFLAAGALLLCGLPLLFWARPDRHRRNAKF